MSDWKPHKKSKEILTRAWAMVESVPYAVSARWLFYGMLQEGFYSGKKDYKNKFLPLLSKARHEFHEGWYPGTLVDDTRSAITRGRGYGDARTPDDWLDVMSNTICELDKWHNQDAYVELWFEARAMARQFEHYTKNITLVPMGGQPSIGLKWDLAKDLEKTARAYDLPITILYFGDLDDAGGTISETVQRDVRKWCEYEFDFIHCGLTEAHVRRWNVPENPEKPGQFQWEALSDEGARSIITDATSPFLSHGGFLEIEENERKAERMLSKAIRSRT